MNIENLLQVGGSSMTKTLEHLKADLVKIRAGKANPAILDGVKVDYYGTPTDISKVANISITDSKTLSIQPWEKSMLAPIEQSIFQANLGITPMNDGENVRISIPPLTEDRRKLLVKQAKAAGEEAKVSIRNERQKLMNFIKKEVKDGFPEDQGKTLENSVQAKVNEISGKIDNIVKAKENEVMTV
jgi:ribosome recycling factor